MTGKYTLEMLEADKKAREQREAKEREEERERREKESARRAWLQDGGSLKDFEAQWVQLRDEGRRRRVMDADQRARANQRASGVSSL